MESKIALHKIPFHQKKIKVFCDGITDVRGHKSFRLCNLLKTGLITFPTNGLAQNSEELWGQQAQEWFRISVCNQNQIETDG
jgi:hypothetical protein